MASDFYKVLGISPSASPDEIKAAYRDLVKAHHPDLFSSAAEKARATEILTQINEAYALLGDPEKRRAFDEQRAQSAASRRSRPATTARRRASSRPAGAVPKRRIWVGRQALRWRPPAIPRKSIKYIIGVVILAYFGFSVGSQRQVATAWTLFEQTIIEPPQNNPRPANADGKWHPMDSYDSKPQCAEGLKSRARRDELEGSKVILDERHGTSAITVFVDRLDSRGPAGIDIPLAEGRAGAAKKPEGEINKLSQQENPAANETHASIPRITKRIRNYECRETQFLRESWLRRQLKQLGFSS